MKQMPRERRERVEQTMAKYGDNKWWESNDPIEIATYQLFEDVLLVDFSEFYKSVGTFLGRRIRYQDVAYNTEGLQKEVRDVLNAKKNEKKLLFVKNEDQSERGVKL